MGAGLPTTATYIVLVTMAAPALAVLGIVPIVAHFYVFFYGVLADITPPVAVAAYAGAGIAGANPFKAGNTAFKLGNAKALVPMVFVYAPSLLLVVDSFTWNEFFIALSGCIIGIIMIGTAFTGYFFINMPTWQRWLLGVSSLFVFAPNLEATAAGLLLASPVFVFQFKGYQYKKAAKTASA